MGGQKQNFGTKAKQDMKFVVKDVEEFEYFKFTRNLSFYGKK